MSVQRAKPVVNLRLIRPFRTKWRWFGREKDPLRLVATDHWGFAVNWRSCFAERVNSQCPKTHPLLLREAPRWSHPRHSTLSVHSTAKPSTWQPVTPRLVANPASYPRVDLLMAFHPNELHLLRERGRSYWGGCPAPAAPSFSFAWNSLVCDFHCPGHSAQECLRAKTV